MKFGLNYQDTVTIVEVESQGYRGAKIVVSQHDVSAIFLQGTLLESANFQENIDADAVIYVKPEDPFIVEESNRLEGLYVLAPLFDITNNEAWYKITNVKVNRDHLLSNRIDNIRCLLKKTEPIGGVS